MLTKVETLDQLIALLPAIMTARDRFHDRWGTDLDRDEFLQRLFAVFGEGGHYFHETDVDGTIKFLALLVDGTKPADIEFWVFHANPRYHTQTGARFSWLKDWARSNGRKRAFFRTQRITRAYDRFAKKHGGEKYALDYVVNL